MKKLILLFGLLISIGLGTAAQTTVLTPSSDDSSKMDTIVMSTIEDAADPKEAATNLITTTLDRQAEAMSVIGVVSIIMIFGLPLFIVALVLWFRYKNKQARYRLAAEALAHGKEIPNEFYQRNSLQTQNNEILSKGIKNIFLGIGLGVFLWVLTEEESLAAIGFIIICLGLGQVVTAYATRSKDNQPTDIEKQ